VFICLSFNGLSSELGIVSRSQDPVALCANQLNTPYYHMSQNRSSSSSMQQPARGARARFFFKFILAVLKTLEHPGRCFSTHASILFWMAAHKLYETCA
jgi:hypothetical protein